MKILSGILILSSVILTSCGGGGGGGGTGGTGPNPPVNTNTVELKASPEGYFYGIVDALSPKEKIITLTNNGGKASAALGFSGLPGSFTISENNCLGVTLAPSASCTFKVTMTANSDIPVTGNLNISSSGLPNYTLRFAGKAMDYQSILENYFVVNLLVNQDSNNGSWTSEGQAFDMGATLFAASSLVKSKIKANYSQDIFSGFGGLDKTIDYFQTTDDDGNGTIGEPTDSDDVKRNINFTSDLATIIPEWERTMPAGGMRLREVLPSFPLVLESMTQLKDGSNSNIFSQIDNFVTSRRESNVAANSLMAQYAFIMDHDRWVNDYGQSYVDTNLNELTELSLRDVYVLFDSLIQNNKTQEAQELSKAVLLNLLSNSSEIFDETGIVMKYSSTAFNHSTFTNANFPDPLFVKIDTCRMNAYVLLLSAMALENADYSELNSLFGNNSLKQDLTNSIKNNLWPNFKTNWIDDLNSDDRTNCLPLAALAAARNSREVVPANVVVDIYNQFINKAVADEYSGPQSSVSVITEAIEAIAHEINN